MTQQLADTQRHVTLAGVLSSSVVHKEVAKARHVARFSLREGGKHHSCVCWGKSGLQAWKQNLVRGDQVEVTGRQVHRQWEDSRFRKHAVVEVVVESFSVTRRANG